MIANLRAGIDGGSIPSTSARYTRSVFHRADQDRGTACAFGTSASSSRKPEHLCGASYRSFGADRCRHGTGRNTEADLKVIARRST
jgi:hypothetical protein